MKRYVKLFILLFVMFININVFAKEDIYIKDVVLDKNSITGDVEVLDKATSDGLNLKLHVRFYDNNSSLKYKVTIQNDSDKDYVMSNNILDNNTNEYIKYIYSYDKNSTIKANSSKTFNITVKYDKAIPNNLLDNGSYNFNNKVEVNLINTFINPDTGRSILFGIIIITVIFISIFFVKKNKKNLLLPLFLLLIFPLSIKAINSITITMNNEIEVYNNMLRSFYGDKTLNSGNVVKTYLPEAFHSSDYIKNITTVDFIKNVDIPDNSVISWDLSNKQDNSIIGYLIIDPNNSENYKLYIGSLHKIYGNITSRYLFYNMIGLTDINYNSYFDTSRVEDMSRYYYNCDSLNDFYLDELNTSNVTDMSFMFYGNPQTTIDFSGFNTSNVTNMSSMFASSGYESLDLSGFDVSKVNTMSSMFSTCTKLVDLDVSTWKTSSLENMTMMFYGCTSLLSLDLNHFDTSHVTTIKEVFDRCYALKEIHVDKWNTSNVTDMSIAFNFCQELTEIDVRNWDVSKVTDFSYIFDQCNKLEALDLSKWKNEVATNMERFVQYAYPLKELDLSGFKTTNVTTMERMVNGCSSMETLDVRNMTFDSVKTKSYAFDCKKTATIYVKDETAKNWILNANPSWFPNGNNFVIINN